MMDAGTTHAPDMAGFAATLDHADIPEAVLTVLRRSFADILGVAAIGATTDLSAIARRVAPVCFGAGGARMLMDGRGTSAAGAAMAGAFTIDAVDAHDSTSPNKGHAGSAVFPALLALADTLKVTQTIDGAAVAAWLAIGYEVSCRAGQVQHATCADYHTSGAWTAVGVAAMAARMLGGSSDQIRHAAGIGEYHGPRSQMMRCIDHPTMVRDGVGWGAPSGVVAAHLALAGFTGAPALTCESVEAAPFWADLGTRWLTLEHTSWKPYPCCRWAHPSIDAVQHLMAAHALTPDDVAGVEIRTFHNATRLAGHEPQTLDDFSYSIAFPVAAMIVRGRIGAAELTGATLHDAAILRISRAVTLIEDAEMERRSATGKRWAQVTILTRDGRRLEDAPRTPRGDADLPMSDAEMSAKFHGFADDVLGRERADRIEALALRFDSLDAGGIGDLMDLVLAPVAMER